MKFLALALALALVACEDPFAAKDVRFYQAVTTGAEHSCAVATDGAAYCWGRGLEGQLGNGIKANTAAPTRVRGNFDFTQITAGVAHTCALATDGAVYCWGWNAFFERGNVTDPRDAEPVPIETSMRFRSISAGDNHTCAISLDSLAYCWGANTHGQLGGGGTRTRAQPLPVSGNVKFAQITAGGRHTCALTTNGAAYCWGRNDLGQLGVGLSSAPRLTPTAVAGGIAFAQIDAGTSHTCAAGRNQLLYCWGSNEFGELGFGGASAADESGAPFPAGISPLFPAGSTVSAGDQYTCALGFDNIGRCWGRGDFGQLGNGATATHYHPQIVYLQPNLLHQGDLFAMTGIATGGRTHACALADERVYCWGSGAVGQLGVPSSSYVLLPQRISD